MDVTPEVMSPWLQLGIAGATLFILLICIVTLFKFMSKFSNGFNNAQAKSIDNLCEKIDKLVTTFTEYNLKMNEVLICNNKDQKQTMNLLERILDMLTDLQKRVVRIDDRTYSCIGSQKEESTKG